MRTELLITTARKVILAMNKCVFNFIDILMKAVEEFSTKINNFSAFKSIKTFNFVIKKFLHKSHKSKRLQLLL